MFSPEHVILKQDSKGDGIFFVTTGDCVVNVNNNLG